MTFSSDNLVTGVQNRAYSAPVLYLESRWEEGTLTQPVVMQPALWYRNKTKREETGELGGSLRETNNSQGECHRVSYDIKSKELQHYLGLLMYKSRSHCNM